jgi:hypothetical protein
VGEHAAARARMATPLAAPPGRLANEVTHLGHARRNLHGPAPHGAPKKKTVRRASPRRVLRSGALRGLCSGSRHRVTALRLSLPRDILYVPVSMNTGRSLPICILSARGSQPAAVMERRPVQVTTGPKPMAACLHVSQAPYIWHSYIAICHLH